MTAGFVAFSWLGAVFLRPVLRVFVRGRSNVNDVVGYVLSCFCVFYGILLGLLAVAAYQNYSQAELTVTREAAALAALYQDVSGYPEPDGQNLRWQLRDYTRYVVRYEWPLQRKGVVPDGGNARVTAFQQKLLEFEPATTGDQTLHAETLRQFNTFLEYRRLRLYAATTGLPIVMWYVVIIGSVINIALVWLFDMLFVTHLFLGGLLAFFLANVILLVAAMDNPFRGEVSIPADAFENIYKSLMAEG